MDTLWSFSTTIRNPERIPGFLTTVAELEGEEWTKETQMKLQALLIKNRLYVPTPPGLSEAQLEILNDLNHEMTYEEARAIFDSKHYKDAPMRGRTSFDPIEKMGFVHVIDGKIRVSDLGRKYINGEVDFGEVVFRTLLKQQYPNPLVQGFGHYNTKPFINTLRIINEVNRKCKILNITQKGISREEFGIFVLSLKDYNEIENVVDRIINFRQHKDSLGSNEEKKSFVENYINDYLSTFQKPIKNTVEYSDNMIRILRLTRFIYIRGNGYYIDLEPRRSVEINSILDVDDGSAKDYTKEEWIRYMSDYNAYPLPWEEPSKLQSILSLLHQEINSLQVELEFSKTDFPIVNTIDEINEEILKFRILRTELQTSKLKLDFENISNVDNTIDELKNIRQLRQKASIELERLSTESLNILNDAIKIKPNYPVGDDNVPTFTAPARVPDIECEYDSFESICEVTMLTGRDQWFNEGQPVMRHLKEFSVNKGKETYCLFVAPRLHTDTINTFWYAVKYNYEGIQQKIIPITIDQLILLLEVAKLRKQENNRLSHLEMKQLFDICTDVEDINSSIEWKSHIDNSIEQWITV